MPTRLRFRLVPSLLPVFCLALALRAQGGGITGQDIIPECPAWVHHAVVYQIYPQTFYDSNGVLQSAFQKDMTIIRGIMEHDFQMRHQASIAVNQFVTWAPATS